MALLEFGTQQGGPSMSEIMQFPQSSPNGPKLYLGSASAASNKDLITSHQISAVLTIASDLNLKYPSLIIKEHKTIQADDSLTQDLSCYFLECVDFIQHNLAQGRNLLVHCLAGVSRSSTIVIAFLIIHLNWSFQRAYDFVKERRPVISPNATFIRQLRTLDDDSRKAKDNKLAQG